MSGGREIARASDGSRRVDARSSFRVCFCCVVCLIDERVRTFLCVRVSRPSCARLVEVFPAPRSPRPSHVASRHVVLLASTRVVRGASRALERVRPTLLVVVRRARASFLLQRASRDDRALRSQGWTNRRHGGRAGDDGERNRETEREESARDSTGRRRWVRWRHRGRVHALRTVGDEIGGASRTVDARVRRARQGVAHG